MADPDVDVDLAVQPRQPERSLGELIGLMTQDLSRLTRQEIQLAKVELHEEVKLAGAAAAMLAAAAATALVAAIVVAMALAWLLDQWMPRAVAFLLVAVVLGAAAAVMAARGRRDLKQINPVPEQTMDTLKEDLAWAKAQRS